MKFSNRSNIDIAVKRNIVALFDNRKEIWYNKRMSKSKDLREAAVAYKKAGNTYEKTGKVFGVSASTVHRWVKQYEETGDLSNKPLNRSFKKIGPEKLKAYVAEHPDDTQEEVALVFGCCNQAISQAYRRLGITRKKRRSAIKNKILKK